MNFLSELVTTKTCYYNKKLTLPAKSNYLTSERIVLT